MSHVTVLFVCMFVCGVGGGGGWGRSGGGGGGGGETESGERSNWTL